jgi:hypothetical protein
MTKYILIPDHFDGNITCFYNDRGYLVEFALNSWNVGVSDQGPILQDLGYLLMDKTIPEFAQKHGMKWRKARIDLSFERFWTMYGNARDKLRAQRVWDRLSETKKYHVLLNLKGYLRWCKRNPGYTQMYPEAYLKDHIEDNWDKVPDWTGAKNGVNV